MLASSRYDGIVPAQSLSLMSLTTLKSRRWADGTAGRCSAWRHRRSTSHGRVARAEPVGLAVDHEPQPPLYFDCARNVYKLVTPTRAGQIYGDEIDIQETHTKHRKLDS